MADQKRFNGQVGFTNDVQIKIAGEGVHGPTAVLFGKNEADKADPYQQSVTPLYELGTELVYGGRHYRYGRLGSGGVTVGKCLQTSPLHADTKNLTPVAAAVGSRQLTVELAGQNTGDLFKDFFIGGYAVISDDAGEGFAYKIKSSPALDVSESQTLVLTLHDPIQVAITTSSRVDLIVNPYAGLVVAPHGGGTHTGAVVGVTAMSMTANYYGWVQTKGVASVLTQGALVEGHAVHRSIATTDGAVSAVGENFIGGPPVGTCIHNAGTGKYSTIDLNIN